MELTDNALLYQSIEKGLQEIKEYKSDPIFNEPFTKDFSLRFCWSSNAIEGNTLSLDETVSLIEYDEVKAGHTFTEYQEAKNLYSAIRQFLIPLSKKNISEDWIKKANAAILGGKTNGSYRDSEVYIGSVAEAVYYPPAHEKVPGLMKEFFERYRNTDGENPPNGFWEQLALRHIRFEQIHPFKDGNGRVGRMLMNQELINHGFLPVSINPTGKYRQGFQRYEKHNDLSLMIRQICNAQLESIDRMRLLFQKNNCVKHK